MWHSWHPDFPLVLVMPFISSQKRNILLFCLPIMADSAEYCMETVTNHYGRYSMQCWLSPQSAVLNVSHFFLDFLLLSPMLHHNFFHANRCTMFISLHMFITYSSCFFKLCNSLIDGVSWWCNTNRKLSLSVHSNKRTIRRVKGFDNEHYLVHHMWHHLVTQFSVA
jgi:hypothetical protein